MGVILYFLQLQLLEVDEVELELLEKMVEVDEDEMVQVLDEEQAHKEVMVVQDDEMGQTLVEDEDDEQVLSVQQVQLPQVETEVQV